MQATPYWPYIFKAMEEHPGLRTLVVKDCPQSYFSDEHDSEDNDSEDNVFEDEEYLRLSRFNYSLLEQLLSRNRNITVYDNAGNYFSNGPFIDSLYLLNHFYCGSATLVKESTSWRPLLVATALMENASEDFQYISLLLSNHVDVLCEFIQGMHGQEASVTSQSVPNASESHVPIPHESNQADPVKRKARVQPPRAAKKAARK